MDLRGAIVETFGFILALLCLSNGATKDGVPGLVRFNLFFEEVFGFSIPFLTAFANNTFYVLIAAVIGVLMVFKGKTIIQMLKKILTLGK